MTWHVCCLFGENDNFQPEIQENDQIMRLQFRTAQTFLPYIETLINTLESNGLHLKPEVFDLLIAAIAAYSADLRISRGQTDDGWTRDIVLHLAVHDSQRWRQIQDILRELLSFLTGDYWAITIRQLPSELHLKNKVVFSKSALRSNIVSLFSGGLDSFVGAIDQIQKHKSVVLVGHYGRGGATSVSQNQSIAILREYFDPEIAPFFPFWIAPSNRISARSEITTRARSIIFFALGIAVASSIKDSKLLIPENGFISLNVPLTSARLGSYSTRTTHPYLIQLFRELLEGLDVKVEIDLPYRFLTKGEMLKECSNSRVLEAGFLSTISCSRPSIGRFLGMPNTHCGYCVPCLIRRASIHKYGIEDPTVYSFKDLSAQLEGNRGVDLRAFRIAIERHARRSPDLRDILSAGRLPGTKDDLLNYLGVYQRGLVEVEKFLEGFEIHDAS